MNDVAFRSPEDRPAAEDRHDGIALAAQLQEFIGGTEPAGSDERRSRDRFPIFSNLRLTPVDEDGTELRGETRTIIGKDLSVRGISFLHDFDLSHPRAVISFTHPAIGQFAVEVEITWTRQTPIGLYESGCRLLRTVDGHNIRLQP